MKVWYSGPSKGGSDHDLPLLSVYRHPGHRRGDPPISGSSLVRLILSVSSLGPLSTSDDGTPFHSVLH